MIEAQLSAKVRPLTANDLKQVIDIDAYIDSRRRPDGGRRRPVFFEKRMDAALADPGYFIYIGYEDNGTLQGYLQASLLEGEYGSSEPVAVLDNIGVEPDSYGQGIGRTMMQDFESILRHKRIRKIHTQADWRNKEFLQFLSATDFRIAPRQVLEREVSFVDTVVQSDPSSQSENREMAFSDPGAGDIGMLERDVVVCRSMLKDDLPVLIRIDKKITGAEHAEYYGRKVKEAFGESGIRVSMVAEVDGHIVGFIMARVDFGEFGRTEPTAVLDTIAVDPGFAHHHIGSVLLSQLLANLTTLRLETIRTEVDADHFDILNFLMKSGFHPSQELAFSKSLN